MVKQGILLKYLNRRGGKGNYIIFFGPTDSGKTTLLNHAIKWCLDDDFEVLTTMQTKEKPKGLKYIRSLRTLISEYTECKGKIVIPIDDAQAIFDATIKASTKKSKTIFDLYVHIAKLQANLIFIAHDVLKVPSTLTIMNPLYVELIRPGTALCMGREFSFPKETPFTFFKAQFSGFDTKDFPLEQLFNELSKLTADSNEELIEKNKQAMREFLLEHPEDGFGISKRHEVELFLRKLGPGTKYFNKEIKINQKKIAEILEIKPAYVSRIKNELID